MGLEWRDNTFRSLFIGTFLWWRAEEKKVLLEKNMESRQDSLMMGNMDAFWMLTRVFKGKEEIYVEETEGLNKKRVKLLCI